MENWARSRPGASALGALDPPPDWMDPSRPALAAPSVLARARGGFALLLGLLELLEALRLVHDLAALGNARLGGHLGGRLRVERLHGARGRLVCWGNTSGRGAIEPIRLRMLCFACCCCVLLAAAAVLVAVVVVAVAAAVACLVRLVGCVLACFLGWLVACLPACLLVCMFA